jgi:hypothetical protein
VKAFSLSLAERSVAAPVQSRALAATAAPAKGVVPPPKALKGLITKGIPAGGAAGGIGFWEWIAAHPYESGAIVLLSAGAIGGAAYALNGWHQVRQEAPTPNLIPVLV